MLPLSLNYAGSHAGITGNLSERLPWLGGWKACNSEKVMRVGRLNHVGITSC